MAKGDVRRQLWANRHVRSVSTKLAAKVGMAALIHAIDRMIPAEPKPPKRVRLAKAVAPIAGLAAAGALGRLIYQRSEARRHRRGATSR